MPSDRRAFLARLVLGALGLISAALGVVTGGYVLGGAGRGRTGRWTPIALPDALEPGQPIHVDYFEIVPDAWATIRRRKSLWLVANENGDLVGFDPHCTHLGCPYDWDPAEAVFKCPCHGGVFDIEGRVLAGPPPRPLDRVDLRIADGRLLLGGILRSEASR